MAVVVEFEGGGGAMTVVVVDVMVAFVAGRVFCVVERASE